MFSNLNQIGRLKNLEPTIRCENLRQHILTSSEFPSTTPHTSHLSQITSFRSTTAQLSVLFTTLNLQHVIVHSLSAHRVPTQHSRAAVFHHSLLISPQPQFSQIATEHTTRTSSTLSPLAHEDIDRLSHSFLTNPKYNVLTNTQQRRRHKNTSLSTRFSPSSSFCRC